MIHLTRLRHGESLYLNPDMIERVDARADTIVRLHNDTEYVVQEPADEIVRKIIEFRARIFALAGIIQAAHVAGTEALP